MPVLRAIGVFAAVMAVTGAPPLAAQTAQPPAPNTAEVNLQDFDFVVDKITQNYAGWDTKVTPDKKAELAALTERLRKQATTASEAELAKILSEWVAFFKDGHTRVFALAPAPAPGANPAASTDVPAAALDEKVVRARLSALGKQRDPLEGIWRIGDGRYRVGILRDAPKGDHFTAVVLTTTVDTWRPGQIKGQIVRGADGALATTYFLANHSKQETTATLVAGGAAIAVAGWGQWLREVPAVPDPELVARQFPSDALFLKPLSARTWWLRIPDFDESRAKPLAELLAKHKADLHHADNLVIDLRDNGGGSDFVYAPLKPLLYTRPVYTINVEVRVSPDNIALRKAVADTIRAEAPGTAAELDEQVKQMAAERGRYMRSGPLSFFIDRQAAPLPYPRRIAVLVDGAMSTGEQLLLEARQSHKVTLFGQRNSAGILDFANVVGMDTPSKRFRVNWASTRSLRLPDDPVDPDGIAPDIRIPATEADPVRYAQRWLERQVD